MTITAALVLFSVLWFLFLFIILPLKIKTQHEVGNRAAGTPSSAPDDPKIKIKMLWVTILAFIAWIICMLLIYLIFLR